MERMANSSVFFVRPGVLRTSDRFYSPHLTPAIGKIAKTISQEELAQVLSAPSERTGMVASCSPYAMQV